MVPQPFHVNLSLCRNTCSPVQIDIAVHIYTVCPCLRTRKVGETLKGQNLIDFFFHCFMG